MRLKIAAVAACVAMLAGCYHVTVITGAPPSQTVIDMPWQLSFVGGLVPPPVLNVAQDCPQGVAEVVTELSPMNALVHAVQGVFLFGATIVTPMHATVTCAGGPVAR